MAKDKQPGDLDTIILSEVQLLLSEKRTALSALRTGIAILAVPVSVLSVLVATSKFYVVGEVLPLLGMLAVINLGLILLAVYMIVRAISRIHHYDRLILEFKRRHSKLRELLD